MAIFPKRVWTKKGMVFNDKKPVRKLGDKVGVYDPNFTEIDSGKVYPEKDRENVASTDELLIYDGEQPTEIGTFEDGLESTYQFVDWDGTVLKSGTVKDGETPVAPADPTREHYTFTGWNPTVGPINKNTTYSAVYESSAATITLASTEDCYGTVFFTITPDAINASTGDEISLAQDFSSITIGEQVATVKGNLTNEVHLQTVGGVPTACIPGAIPTSCTQIAPTEGALPATVAGSATFYFDGPLEEVPVGGIQTSSPVLDNTLTDGRPSISWVGRPGDSISILPVNVDISGATTIELSNPTLLGGVADALTATVSSGNIELYISATESGSHVGGVEFDFVVDGFTMAHVLVYINLTVDASSY